ncbi:vitamin K-dependent protein C [Austrofundulus limnaeus]|uniref:Vitamin K-dependent protein C n=1 Tax=Austrofundulus limnaeus TaxID=52670 RepID=A0A2I4D281_AUSLI|nr:PREDICTED: vitamin K-dependent protein C-like [Austrofundulus limnaeus]XP_013886338.1 PREDICTED: vitamin K-dependent protein C-like [Austrofundulus limnaeus]
MSRLGVCVLVCVALWSSSVSSLSVFSEARRAHMLLRSRRANSFLEELKPGSMERECVEERCDFEEAREILQTREATLEFWTVYTDGNQCVSNMCVHGVCVDQLQEYVCSCFHGYEGKYCDYNVTATNCSVENGDCDHECTESEDGLSRTCSCLPGYRLDNNNRKCVPKGKSSCGQLLINRSEYVKTVPEGPMPWTIGGEVGRKGESPWQVVVFNARGKFHCGGVLIDKSWVLTAAHCIEGNNKFSVRLGDYERLKEEGSEVTLPVVRAFKHPSYNSRTVDNDIALLRLQTPAPLTTYILPVCLPSSAMAERALHLNGTVTVVSGWGKQDNGKYSSALNVIKVPLVNRSICSQHMFPHQLSDNVLCAGILGQSVDACEGDSGGPMVTLYRDTWFLIGLVSWGEGCGLKDKLGIYTKVSNYNQWINQVQEEWDRRHRPQ